MHSSTHYVTQMPKSKNKEDSALSSGIKMVETPEESSWTYYIEGFMCENGCNNIDNDYVDGDDQNCASSSQHDSPSLISDASSSAILKKLNSADDNHKGFSSGRNNNINNKALFLKQSSFKKQKTSFISTPLENYDLEDTASSPVNSPKTSYMNQVMNQKEMAKMDVSKVKRDIFGKSGALT